LKLIQKNLLYEKGAKTKKIQRGDFAKKYVSGDKHGDEAAPERFHSSSLVNQAEAEVHNANLHVPKL
jgi:hypothetical protein